jgi:general L-amino acid transport system permease protein
VIDSILTLISITVVVLLVPPLVDWAILNGVWNANSLDECREIVAATHGEGAQGACWAVFNGRIGLLLFGFYPPELFWRPVMAFVLLFVALAPILFSSLPRRMLWFSAIYPIIAFILIWGGFGLEVVESVKIGGFLLAITIAVTGIATAISIGFVLALGRQFSILAIRTICAIFIEFIRGVPLIVLLFAGMILLN